MSHTRSSSARISGDTFRSALAVSCLFTRFEDAVYILHARAVFFMMKSPQKSYQIRSLSGEMSEGNLVEGNDR